MVYMGPLHGPAQPTNRKETIMKQLMLQSPLARLARLTRALRHRGEEGMAILEYAVGLLVVAGVGFIVFKLIQSGDFFDFLLKFAGQLFNIISGLWPF
jgi:hypothetical protein